MPFSLTAEILVLVKFLREYLSDVITDLLAGFAFLPVLLFIEASFHYPLRAHQEVLLPVFLFSLSYYFLFSLLAFFPVAPVQAGLRRLLEWLPERFPAMKLNGPLRFLRSRLHLLWILFMTASFFWMIGRAYLLVGMPFYLIVTAAAVVFSLAGGRRVMGALFLMAVTGTIALAIQHAEQQRVPAPPGPTLTGAPNILLLVSDTTNRSHLNFYGYNRKTMPHMARLAEQGALFEKAYSTSGWTKPATASLVTGRFLCEDAIHRGPGYLEYDGMTLAGFYRRQGYDTALISANSNASSFFGQGRGYGYRRHSLPPPHAALQKFTAVKYFDVRFAARTALNLKNMDISLAEYCEHLKLRPGEISGFASGRVKARIELSPNEELRFRRRIAYLIARKTAAELRYLPTLAPARRGILFRYFRIWYRAVLDFYYIRLEGASGEIVTHWIKDRELSQDFIAWLDRRPDSSRPFLAHLQYMGPHTPYVTQRPLLLSHFDPDYPAPVITPPTQHTPPSIPGPRLGPRKERNLIANYDDTLRITDASIQYLLEALRVRGLLDNTIIVFLSDHGEAFYEHGIYGHMNSLHRELVEIPLFFHYPRRLRPVRSGRPASIVDVFPSLLVLSGFEQSLATLPRLEGKSLFSLRGDALSDKRPDFRVSLATLVGGAWKMKRRTHLPFGIHTGVITSRGKLIYEAEENGTRFFFFRADDKIERRIPIDFDRHSPSADIRAMKRLLPAGPDL